MEHIKVKGDLREVGKKGVTNRIRLSGFIPAILYGKGEAPIAIKIPAKDFTTALLHAGTNALIDLEIPGRAQSIVMLKDFQTNTITHVITHADLLKISMQEKITIEVPIHLTGKAIGLSKGGLVEQSRRELEVRCLPGKIPDAIDVDITHLDMGHSVHIGELKLPEGVEVPHDVDFAIVSIVAPREEEIPAAAVAPEAAVVEGAAPAAEGTAPAPAPEGKAEKKS